MLCLPRVADCPRSERQNADPTAATAPRAGMIRAGTVQSSLVVARPARGTRVSRKSRISTRSADLRTPRMLV